MSSVYFFPLVNRERNVMSLIYDHSFYVNRDKETEYTAYRVLSIINQHFDISSVADVGCGVGTWLRTFKKIASENGKRDVIINGYDGEYVEKYLVISNDCFTSVNLEERINDCSKHDLCISLEVAEHLPQWRAASFVEDLCTISDIILFSAATRLQGGNGHVNEQRIDYWSSLFEKQGYKCMDFLRLQIWNDDQIPFWYKQNMVLFVKGSRQEKFTDDICYDNMPLSLIHPDLFEEREERRLLYEQKLDLISKLIYLNFSGELKKTISNVKMDSYLIYGLGDLGKILYMELLECGAEVYGMDRLLKAEDARNGLYNNLDDVPSVNKIIIASLKYQNEIMSICKSRFSNTSTSTISIYDWVEEICQMTL